MTPKPSAIQTTPCFISRLSSVKDIGVISRTSVMQYKGTKKAIRDIGGELGVDFILEGTVRWGKAAQGASRVRITPQLIRVNEDTHMWSDRYDRVIEDIFDVQSDIAEKVESIKREMQTSAAKLDTLFDSLQHRAFAGEL